MKTITTVEELDVLPEGAVIKTADGTVFLRIGKGVPPWRGSIWQDEECRWVDSPAVTLPATLIHPLVFDADDVERVARVLCVQAGVDPEESMGLGVSAWVDFYDQACAVLGTVGSVE